MNEKRASRRRRKPKSATIHVLPGVERRDIGNPVESATMLQMAIESSVQDVTIVGRRPDGSFYLASADFNIDAVVGKLLYAAIWLATNDVKRADGS